MPPVTLTSTVVDLSKIKMKWKEQYVSEGLNHKTVGMPKGIYQGLRLVENISSPRLVSIGPGSDTAHAAVYQSATGFSLTYYDVAGSAIVLDLSNASLDSQETVIALSITYTIGADTTANWIAFPIADWNALTDAQRGELLVLGTIDVPAAATNITSAMIRLDRRSYAWEAQAAGAVPWSPVVKNPSFEHGASTDTTRFSVSDWDKGTVAVNGNFRLGTSTVRSGAKSLEFNKTNVAASTATLVQYLEIPVVPGQLVKVSGWIRQLIAPTAGSIEFTIVWGDADSVSTTPTGITASVLSTTDASYRKIERTIAVPSGSYVLKSFAIFVNGVTSGSTGVAAVFDDVQVYVETGSPQALQSAVNSRLRQQTVSSVLFAQGDSYDVTQLSALMRFVSGTPTGEGSVLLERRDQVAGSLPPAFDLPGRISSLGANLIGSEVNALKPRITAPVSTAGGVDFTLMWESKPSGQVGYRKYVSASGEMIHTVNAVWGGTTWSKDVNGVAALKDLMTIVAQPQRIIYVRDAANNSAWADGSWDQDPFNFNFGTVPLFEIVASMNIFGDLWLSNNSNITLNGTGKYKRGTRVRHISATAGTVVSTPIGNHDYFSLTGYVFTKGNGDRFGIPIYLEEGEQLNQVVGHVRNGVGDQVAMRVFRDSVTVGSGTLGNTQLGTTQTSAGTSNLFEALTVSGLTETVPNTNVVYWAEYRVTAFSGGPILAGLQVTTTVP